MTAYESGWRDAAAGLVQVQMYTLMPGYRNGHMAQVNHNMARGVFVVMHDPEGDRVKHG